MLDVERRDADEAERERQAEHDERDERDARAAFAAEAALDRTIAVGRIGGEALAWAGVLLTATIIRLASLGTDALSADGARHAYAAYTLFRGSGTALDSAVGGPFAVLLGALLLFLFGVSDEIVRLGPALAGIGLVALMIPLRPYLGRAGAILAALLLAVSPSVVYFSRQERPDAYATFFATLFFVALLRLFDHGRRGDLILAACAAALLFVAAPVGLTLLIILVVAGVATGLRGGEPTAADPRPFGVAGLRAARDGALPALLLAVAILLLVFSAFGAVPGNLAGGPIDWFEAWGSTFVGAGGAEPGRTGGFALGLLPLYEPLALLAGLWAIGRLVAARGAAGDMARGGVTARGILAGWAIVGVALLAVGGATQPNLLLLPVVPLTMLAGSVLGELVERIDWRRDGAFWLGGWGLILCAALAVAAWGATLGQVLQPTRFPDETSRALSLLVTILLFALPLTGAAIWFARRIDGRTAALALALGVSIFLLGYGLRSAVGLSIYRADAGNEPLVYNASTPEVRPLMNRVLRVSRDLTALNRTIADPTGGHGLSIAIDPAVEWPTRWYLRDFPDLRVVPATQFASAGGVPPQLIFRPVDDAVQVPGDFQSRDYKLRWSYPAGQPLTGTDNAILRSLAFLVFRNRVAPVPSVDMRVDYGPETAARLFPVAAPQGPFNLTERPGQGKAPGQLDNPRGVAAAPDGSIYVVDMRNTRVQHFAADGAFIGQFGTLGRNDGQFWREASRGPTGIAVGPDGSIYVADTWNYRIQKFSPDGQFVAKWGTYVNLVTGPAPADRNGFFGPRGIAIGLNGDLYVTDTGNGRVVVYGPDGALRREFAMKGTGPAQLDEPVGIAISKDGSRVYVADSNNARIAIFDAEGRPVAQWAVPDWRGRSFFEPYLALDPDGALYATSSGTRQVFKFGPDGQIVARTTGGATADETFGAPYGIAFAPDGAFLVSDGAKHFVIKLEPLR